LDVLDDWTLGKKWRGYTNIPFKYANPIQQHHDGTATVIMPSFSNPDNWFWDGKTELIQLTALRRRALIAIGFFGV